MTRLGRLRWPEFKLEAKRVVKLVNLNAIPFNININVDKLYKTFPSKPLTPKTPSVTSTPSQKFKMSEGQILKPDKDFSKEVDKQLPEAEQLAQVGRMTAIPMIQANIILE